VRRFWDAATREQKMFRYKSCVRYEKYTSNNCHDGRVFVLTFCEYIYYARRFQTTLVLSIYMQYL